MGDTIHALATVPGKAGLAVIRISGPDSPAILRALGGTLPDHRSTRLTTLRSADGRVLDQALVLYFREGASFTGEDVVELHVHGSIAVVDLVLRALAEIGLSRIAEPGEFTRRALLNDRLDLTQVQGLADVIDAETGEQHRQAMRVFEGELSRRVNAWRTDLIRAAALIEAVIDFADEDVPVDVVPEVRALVGSVAASIRSEVQGVRAAERIRSGFTVAIIGEPNSGKSTLLNALTRSDAAIVSEIPGTTRDVIEVRMNVGGYVLSFLDTAGLRATDDRIELLGIERAIARSETADLRIFLHDGETPPSWPIEVRPGDVVVRSKIDLVQGASGISSVSGEGITDLMGRVSCELSKRSEGAGLVSRERDRLALVSALETLEGVSKRIDGLSAELIAADLRAAMTSLRGIIGGIDTEALLGEIFSSFCIGK